MSSQEVPANQYQHHMKIDWMDFVTSDNITPATEANLAERAVIV